MNSKDLSRNDPVSQQEASTKKSTRLHYLDWLRNILIFGVFLYHVLKPFDPMMA